MNTVYSEDIYDGGSYGGEVYGPELNGVIIGANMLIEASTTILYDDGRVDIGPTDGMGYLLLDGYVQNAGVIDGGENGQIFIDLTDSKSPQGVHVAATLNNTGTLANVDISPFGIYGAIGDEKVINSGTMRFYNGGYYRGFEDVVGVNIMGTGSIILDEPGGYPSQLILGAEVSTGQTVDMQSGGLEVDNLKGFHATIANFNSNDIISLPGVAATSAVYNNGRLDLYDASGNDVGVLHFKRPAGATFNTDTFQVNNGTITTSNTIFHSA